MARWLARQTGRQTGRRMDERVADRSDERRREKAYRQTSGDSKNIHTDWAVIGEKLGMDGRTDKSNESKPVDKVSRSDK